jgi:hypothetical protein
MNGIFENQSEVIDNIKESAKQLGIDLGGIPEQTELVVKKNCKKCWGKGWLTYNFPGNNGDEEVFNFYCICVKRNNTSVS